MCVSFTHLLIRHIAMRREVPLTYWLSVQIINFTLHNLSAHIYLVTWFDSMLYYI